jgi:hypothetical protein
MSFYEKYLKYKQKYIDLKNFLGGAGKGKKSGGKPSVAQIALIKERQTAVEAKQQAIQQARALQESEQLRADREKAEEAELSKIREEAELSKIREETELSKIRMENWYKEYKDVILEREQQREKEHAEEQQRNRQQQEREEQQREQQRKIKLAEEQKRERLIAKQQSARVDLYNWVTFNAWNSSDSDVKRARHLAKLQLHQKRLEAISIKRLNLSEGQTMLDSYDVYIIFRNIIKDLRKINPNEDIIRDVHKIDPGAVVHGPFRTESIPEQTDMLDVLEKYVKSFNYKDGDKLYFEYITNLLLKDYTMEEYLKLRLAGEPNFGTPLNIKLKILYYIMEKLLGELSEYLSGNIDIINWKLFSDETSRIIDIISRYKEKFLKLKQDILLESTTRELHISNIYYGKYLMKKYLMQGYDTNAHLLFDLMDACVSLDSKYLINLKPMLSEMQFVLFCFYDCLVPGSNYVNSYSYEEFHENMLRNTVLHQTIEIEKFIRKGISTISNINDQTVDFGEGLLRPTSKARACEVKKFIFFMVGWDVESMMEYWPFYGDYRDYGAIVRSCDSQMVIDPDPEWMSDYDGDDEHDEHDASVVIRPSSDVEDYNSSDEEVWRE